MSSVLYLLLTALLGLSGCWVMIWRHGEDETKRFVSQILPAYLFVITLLVIPFYHQAMHRDFQLLDIVCSLAGILGFVLCSMLVSFHRRLVALEKLRTGKNQQS